ncbi:MAG: hypothetical protein EU547_02060 [Promethearchaeota archaeon]|nr:MAG: hypothetical protein EU547_02060 [Candidatus Lokiarchaeota archaeon]
MNETNTYKRYPAVRCWIHHILSGNYSEEDKSLYTIFGSLKRVRIIATIIDKREILNTESLEGQDSSEARVEFDLDDGTGLIRATLWRVNPEEYERFSKGDLVDVIGLIRSWKDFISISPEIIRKVQNPNKKLLRDAEIIKRIKSGDIQEIPEIENRDMNFNEMGDEIDIDTLFDEEITESTSIKEEILGIIEKYSEDQEGISFDVLLEILNIGEDDLKIYLKELEKNNKIFHNKDIYQSY